MSAFEKLRQTSKLGIQDQHRQFASQWVRNVVLMSLIAVLCLSAMLMAHRAGRSISASYTEAQIASRVSSQTSQIALLTAELQFWQLRVVQDRSVGGMQALGVESKTRLAHNKTLKLLNDAVDKLSAEALKPSLRNASAAVAAAMDGLERADKKMIAALVKNGKTTDFVGLDAAHQSAEKLLLEAKKLNEMTATEAANLQQIAVQENGFIWKAITFAMGGALLLAAVLAWLLLKALTENANLVRESKLAASTDPLTGLLNRRALEQRLEFEFKRASRETLSLTLVMIDLDFFKKYNDTHGHVKGDELLKTCAHQWRNAVRGSDIVARLGGEEFALVMSRCDAQQAVTKMAAFRQNMPWGTNFSAGAAVWREGEPFVDWYKRADAALYAAKHNGRGRTEIAE